MARALKVFAVDSTAAHLWSNHPAAEIIFDEDSHHRSCDIEVVARVKTEAIDRLRATLGQYFAPGSLRVSVSTPTQAYREAGLLAREGDVVVTRRAQHSSPIALIRGDAAPVHAATWRCDRSTDYKLIVEEI
jgi:hypothetical protein